MGPFIVRLGTLAATATLAGGLALAASGTALASGQPNQSCGSATAPNTPGNASSASGSAFNPGGVAGAVYAGSDGTASQTHANSGNAVSQYDVACAQQP